MLKQKKASKASPSVSVWFKLHINI
jgi:hypothetical protein